MNDRFLVLVALFTTPFIGSCAAYIHSFSVTPSTVCPGEPVKVSWQASGKVMLEANPPLVGMGEKPAEGSQLFTPKQSTRFILKPPGPLSLPKGSQREWDVQIIRSRLLGGIAQCGDNSQSVSTSFTIQQEDISPQVHAVLITNNYHRPLLVSKDKTEVEIPPGGTTDHFKDISIIGSWTIRTPVGADESCDSVLKAISSRLSIKALMSCGEQIHEDS
jgi:hypothetical protein